jgi:hypothetical protein
MVQRRTIKRAATPREVDILPQMDWQDVGRKLWAQFIFYRDRFRQAEAAVPRLKEKFLRYTGT